MQLTTKILFYATICCIVVLLFSALGYRIGWLTLQMSFQTLFIGFALTGVIALVSVMLLLARIVRRQSDHLFQPVFTVFVCLFLAGYGAIQYNLSRTIPPIHNISTDLNNPPEFTEAIAQRRGEQTNPLSMSDRTLEIHRNGFYDHVLPLKVGMSLVDTYPLALEAAKDQGWELVTQDAPGGIIEATDTTFWFGFKDDIVVRLTENQLNQTTVDARSVSRIGMSDLGLNADRIGDYLDDLRDLTEQSN